jgi:hypothetical protein
MRAGKVLPTKVLCDATVRRAGILSRRKIKIPVGKVLPTLYLVFRGG